MKIPTNKLLFPALWDISQRSYSFFPVFFRLSHATIVLRLSILVFLTTLSSCISTKKLTYLQESQSAQDRLIQVNLQQPPYHVQINDVLSIRVKALDQELVALFNPQTAGAEGNSLGEGYYYDGFAVDRHGAIRLPTLGEIHVLGYTTEEIRELIEKKLLDDYFTEEANIFVTVKLAGIKYTIGGEIGGPGVKVDLVEQLSLLDAIVNSGDITEYGDRTDVLIIRQYPGGKKIHHIDLTKIEALNSPYYYVQPNDVILVNPLPQKSLGFGTTGLQSLTTVVSILTLATTTILLFSRL
ncbi:polysaccharide biosynthesis/export family protein [Leeuwenhoekiella marinoflava]|uniref:polysaccharide biosynthesis/export family protein n=1 Tax=Leeuwenhoekiella marinoflava TaxID=988 RepID=UPI0030036A26